jgi:hypothetical protein
MVSGDVLDPQNLIKAHLRNDHLQKPGLPEFSTRPAEHLPFVPGDVLVRQLVPSALRSPDRPAVKRQEVRLESIASRRKFGQHHASLVIETEHASVEQLVVQYTQRQPVRDDIGPAGLGAT